MAFDDQYTSDSFMLVPLSAFSKHHFELHPIWSEYYDFEEREEIIDWGVDPHWLNTELDRLGSENTDCVYPILRPYPLPDRMRIFIRAKMTLKDGRTIDGYAMNEDAYCISIFANDAEFFFSRNDHLRDDNRQELRKLASALRCSTADIFPVTYETEFLDSNDELISGEFSCSML